MYKYLLALVMGVCLLGSSSIASAHHHTGYSGYAHHGDFDHRHYANHAVWARYHRVVFVRNVVPNSRVELVTVAPSSNFVWSRGYWAWTGVRYVWAPGSWVRIVPNRVWVQPTWRYRGWNGTHGHRYVHVKGHWR